MKNSDPSFRFETESQFSENDSANESPRHIMQVSKPRPGVLMHLALLQAVCTVVFSVAMFYCFDVREALSAAFGGVIAVIGSLYSAGRLLFTKPDASAVEVLVRFYVSVVLKIIFTLAMMAICLIVMKVSVLPFIIAYLLAAVVVNLLVLLVPAQLDVIDGIVEDRDTNSERI